METPCLCPSEGHKHGGRKYEKTSGVHFCQKRGLFALVNFRMFRLIFLLKLELFRMLKITRRVIFKIRKSSVTAVLLMSRTMETRKLKLFYFQKEARHRAKKLWTDIFLGNLSWNEGKNFVGLPVFNSRIWWRHVKTENIVKKKKRNRKFSLKLFQTISKPFLWKKEKKSIWSLSGKTIFARLRILYVVHYLLRMFLKHPFSEGHCNTLACWSYQQ